MQIEIDEATGEIVVGEFRAKSFRLYRHNGTSPAWKQWVKEVAEKNKVLLPYNKKDFNKAAAEMFKRSPTAMYEHFKKLAYKHFVVPHRDILYKIAYSPRGVNVSALREIVKHKEVLQETYDDKLYQLLPVVAKTGLRPAELKKVFGPKWKTIANNSLNKNKAMSRHFPREAFGEVCDKPTTLIETMNRYVKNGYFDEHLLGFMQHASLHLKGSWSKSSVIGASFNLYRDSCRMASQLGLTAVDPKWTPRRMKEEHDKMSHEINARRCPSTAYASVADIPHKSIEVGEYTAVLLESGFDIAEEGTHMGHCVGSYADCVADGQYLVYSVRKDGERSSTIGFWIEEGTAVANGKVPCVYKFNQHYARFNRPVTCEVEKSIPSKILDILNQKDEQ